MIDKLTHEVAVLKRLKFAATSERFASTLAPEQRSLLEETLDSDLAELEQEINQLGLELSPSFVKGAVVTRAAASLSL